MLYVSTRHFVSVFCVSRIFLAILSPEHLPVQVKSWSHWPFIEIYFTNPEVPGHEFQPQPAHLPAMGPWQESQRSCLSFPPCETGFLKE